MSACSKAALDYALFAAERTGATVTLLHVIEPMRYVMPGASIETPEDVGLPFEEYSKAYFEEELNAFVKDVDRKGMELTLETVLGIAPDTIARRSEEFDLVVMGTHGRSGFQHFVTGSVAARVLRSATCPVVTVREEASKLEKKFDRILVAVDPGEWSKAALKAALEVGELMRADVEALYVWEPMPWLRANLTFSNEVSMSPAEFDEYSQNEARRSLAEFVTAVAGPGPKTELLVGAPAETIVERARAGAFDLVVVGTHGRTGLSRMLLGSVAEKVVRSCPVPVMTVHGK